MSFNRLFIVIATILVLVVPLQLQAASTAQNSIVTPSTLETNTDSAPLDGKINLNTADITSLQNLKGIGEGKAQAIIDYRKEHGSFKSMDELGQVKGFSKKTVDNLLKKNPNKIVVE